MKYDFRRIEEKWQSYWEENGLYTVSDSGKKGITRWKCSHILRANFTWGT